MARRGPMPGDARYKNKQGQDKDKDKIRRAGWQDREIMTSLRPESAQPSTVSRSRWPGSRPRDGLRHARRLVKTLPMTTVGGQQKLRGRSNSRNFKVSSGLLLPDSGA